MCSDGWGKGGQREGQGEDIGNICKRFIIDAYSCYYLQLILIKQCLRAQSDTGYWELYIHKAEPEPLPTTIRVNFESRQFYQFLLFLFLSHHSQIYQVSQTLHICNSRSPLIELPLTYSRTFNTSPNLHKLILTRQVKRLGAKNAKDEDGVNPRQMQLGACGHITQIVKVYAVIGQMSSWEGFNRKEMSKFSSSLLVVKSMSMSNLSFGIKLSYMGWDRNMLCGGRSKQHIGELCFCLYFCSPSSDFALSLPIDHNLQYVIIIWWPFL